MATSSDINPLCVTEACRQIYDVGEGIHKGTVIPHCKAKNLQMPMYYSTQLGIYHVLENLKIVLGGEGKGLIGHQIQELETRLKSLEASYQKTYVELVTGAAPEFNALIDRVVEQKVRELMPDGPLVATSDETLAKGPKKATIEKIQETMRVIDQEVTQMMC